MKTIKYDGGCERHGKKVMNGMKVINNADDNSDNDDN